MADSRLSENVRYAAESAYLAADRIVVRRSAYNELALHQEGYGRSVYLTRLRAVRFAFALLREAVRR